MNKLEGKLEVAWWALRIGLGAAEMALAAFTLASLTEVREARSVASEELRPRTDTLHGVGAKA